MRKKYIKGVKVLKISTEGKPLKRIVYINAKPEYFEITGMRTTKLFDMARHLSGVEAIELKDKSPEFECFRAVHARGTEEITPEDTCCVVTFPDVPPLHNPPPLHLTQHRAPYTTSPQPHARPRSVSIHVQKDSSRVSKAESDKSDSKSKN
eukprot:Selendium_serpulae@DN3313_c0_g1_i6.p1